MLTREAVRPLMNGVTVAPITTTIKGLATEVLLDPDRNGVDQACVISCDNIVTIPASSVGRQIGRLLAEQEPDLTRAILAAFDLR